MEADRSNVKLLSDWFFSRLNAVRIGFLGVRGKQMQKFCCSLMAEFDVANSSFILYQLLVRIKFFVLHKLDRHPRLHL